MREHGVRAYFNFVLTCDTLRTSMSKRRRYRNKFKMCLILHFIQNYNIGYDVIVQEWSLFHPIQNNTCLLIIASFICSAISHYDSFLNKEVRRWVKEMIFFSLALWHHLGWVSVVRVCGFNMFLVGNAWLPPVEGYFVEVSKELWH